MKMKWKNNIIKFFYYKIEKNEINLFHIHIIFSIKHRILERNVKE